MPLAMQIEYGLDSMINCIQFDWDQRVRAAGTLDGFVVCYRLQLGRFELQAS